MAARFLVPTATCSLVGSSAADVKGFVWVGLVAAVDVTACAAFYAGSTTAEPHIWTLAASKGTAVGPVGPFAVPPACSQTVYAQVTGTRASALISTASF